MKNTKKVVIINRYKFIALFIAVSVIFSQFSGAFNTLLANASESGETLVIRHIAKVPGGKERVLGIEEIGNITDIYYYQASQSPVASKFLKNGYSLEDERNRLIEADIVENGGKIDLKYTPALQNVSVTYFMSENGKETEMGTITDSTYVGEEYRPQPPLYDGADVLATLIGNEKYTVKYGEDNDFKVTYEMKKAEKKRARKNSGGSSSRSAKSDDETDSLLTRAEMYELLYGYTTGFEPEDILSFDEMTAYLYEDGVIDENTGEPYDSITWDEFGEHIEALGGNGGLLLGGSGYVRSGEAGLVINEVFGAPVPQMDFAGLEMPIIDAYEDDFVYFDAEGEEYMEEF